jgi:cell division septum initiation protein DivIVA
MFRQVEIVGTGGHDARGVPGADDAPTVNGSGAAPSWPNLSGDIDGLLDTRPSFRIRARGYDRLQVDNYVGWAEWEIVTARRQADHLLSRFGACSAELEMSRRLLAETPKGREVNPVSDRVGEILRLAADEATEMINAARDEADQLLAGSRLEADARLRKAHAFKEMAVAAGDELRRSAEAERDRLDAEAAQAQARADAEVQRLATVQAELADLRRQRDEARTSLRRLTDQIGQVLQAVGPADLAAAAGRPRLRS